MPDSVFIEDAVVMFDDTAVITSPGAESRRGETAAVEDTVRDLGLTIRRIELPGTLDGGDVLKVGRTVYVGRGGRTNAEGIRQLRTIVTPLGFTVVAVPTTKVLHLKSAVTALPDGTVIGYPPLVDDPAIFDRFLAVPEEAGAARRRARQRHRADGGIRPEERRADRRPRLPRRPGGHQRVRKARGLRHLPVGAGALDPSDTSSGERYSRGTIGCPERYRSQGRPAIRACAAQ